MWEGDILICKYNILLQFKIVLNILVINFVYLAKNII